MKYLNQISIAKNQGFAQIDSLLQVILFLTKIFFFKAKQGQLHPWEAKKYEGFSSLLNPAPPPPLYVKYISYN